MSTTHTAETASDSNATPESHATQAPTETLVDLVFDVGTEWAAHGLETGRNALAQSAHTLERLATKLGTLRQQLLAKA